MSDIYSSANPNRVADLSEFTHTNQQVKTFGRPTTEKSATVEQPLHH